MKKPAELLDAFSRAGDAVFAVDQQMHVVFWNAGAERLFGVDAAGAMGRRCDDIVAGFESTGAPLCVPDCRVIGCATRGHAAETYDLVRTDTRGEPQWLSVSVIVLRGRRQHSTLTVHLARDVTARRAVEQRSAAVLRVLDTAPGASLAGVLTRREAEVLRMLACGMTNTAIAEALGISPTTVRNHIERLLPKLGAHSKLEAVVNAARAGLV